jgi:hypothetical protein
MQICHYLMWIICKISRRKNNRPPLRGSGIVRNHYSINRSPLRGSGTILDRIVINRLPQRDSGTMIDRNSIYNPYVTLNGMRDTNLNLLQPYGAHKMKPRSGDLFIDRMATTINKPRRGGL